LPGNDKGDETVRDEWVIGRVPTARIGAMFHVKRRPR